MQNANGNPLSSIGSSIGSAIQGAATAVSSAVSAASPALAPFDLKRTNPVQVLFMSEPSMFSEACQYRLASSTLKLVSLYKLKYIYIAGPSKGLHSFPGRAFVRTMSLHAMRIATILLQPLPISPRVPDTKLSYSR